LITKLSERLSIKSDGVDVRKPFTSYGLSSRDAVELAGELAGWLGRKLSPILIYEYPSIETLSNYLATGLDAEEPGSIVVDDLKAEAEPVAIIGIGCRFPGARNPEEFWTLLRDGRDAVTEIPKNRPELLAYSEANTRWGGFLDQVDEFDAQFFGIAPREARRMDPQQRQLLEVAWEALEDAGQVTERLNGSATGVFIGISSNDYYQLQLSESALDDPYLGTGSALSIAANRLSYFFGFRGPSISIDTACSSSLVAVHLACQSLCTGESTLALTGGVNILLSPTITNSFANAGFLSPEGRCKAFDADADGYVRGEGAGVVVLKLLSRALADCDPVYAVIRGSAVNQDGRTNGLTAPSRQAQEDVLRKTYRRAATSPGQIQYVEAHGTGTALGDPIEAKALGAVLGTGRALGSRCAIGSVKTNIGHLEAAAGIAGLIKVALSLKHKLIPPSLHFHEPNSYIPFQTLPLYVQQSLEPWPTWSSPARAGVSSFGFGGTNAHVVLEAAPAVAENQLHAGDVFPDQPRLLPLSARSAEALESCCRSYLNFLNGNEHGADLSLQNICYTAGARRSHHDYRLALVGRSREEFAAQLEGFLRGDPLSDRGTDRQESLSYPSSGRRIAGREHKCAFVFSGQGTQWLGMAHELLEQEPVFFETMKRCAEQLGEYAGWDLLEELTAASVQSRLHQTEIAQPAICAIQVALAALWRSWGIVPNAVVGHSLGEVAAAHVAGVFNLKDTMKIVFHRSRLMERAAGQGKMAAVGLSVEECETALQGYEGRLDIAAINGPAASVISGDPDALEEVLASLKERNVFARLLAGGYAFHSYQMCPVQSELVEALRDLQPQVASIPVYSTVTGSVSDGENFDAVYWGRNLREPVRFAKAVDRLIGKGYDVFLEVAPRPVLASMIAACFDQVGKQGTVLASIRQSGGERASLLASVSSLYTMGFELDWDKISQSTGRCVSLPSYPWQRERHWLEQEEHDSNRASNQRRPGSLDVPERRLLGPKLKDIAHSPGSHVWEIESRQLSSYLKEHVIQGATVLPATAYIEMALEAADELFGASTCAIEELEFQKILFLPDEGSRRVQVILSPAGAEEMTLRIYSRPLDEKDSAAEWLLHATGKISNKEKAAAEDKTTKPIDFAVMFFSGSENGNGADKYRLVIEASKFADRNGFSSVSVPERHFTEFGSLYPNPAVLHAALARETKNIHLRAGSVVAPLHDPIRIAEEWAMVDNLSGGRVELSFASGWHPNDFAFFPEKYADRHQEMFRAIEIIKTLWQGGSIPVRSGNGEPIEVKIFPTPLQRNVPLWITAAGNPATFAKAGELGANLLTHLLDQDFATLAERISIYRRAREQHGHDSRTGRVSVMLHAFLGANIDVVREQVRGPYKDYLKSISHLLKSLAYSRGRDIDTDALSETERDEFANLLFERFFSKRALLGTPESCFDLVEQLKLIGVDEISCLLDFGLATDLSLNNLPYLNQLREMCRARKDPVVFVPPKTPPAELLARFHEEVDVSEFYERMRAHGVEDGPSFRVVEQLWRNGKEALGKVRPASFAGVAEDHYHVDPALLAACFQVLLATRSDSTSDDSLYLPIGLRKFVLHSPPVPARSLWSHAVRKSGADEAGSGTLAGDIQIVDDDGLLVAEALGVKFQRQTEPVSPDADDAFSNLLYELQWTPKDASGFDYPEVEKKASWILFVDRGGVGERLAALLESRGQTCFRVSAGTTYSVTEDHYTVQPDSREDLDRLMKSILSSEPPAVRGVIHLWSLEICSPEISVSFLDEAHSLGTASALQLIQTLAESGTHNQPRLWLATQGAQAVGPAAATLAIAQSPIWGLGRTCAIEHPEFWGGLLDLDPDASEDENASQLLNGICVKDREDQIAFRQRRMYVARLVRKASLARSELTLRPDATYLVTGGADGLGFQVARWMVARGARHLVLLGRTKLPPRDSWAQIEAGRLARRVAAIRELEELKVQVHYAAVDVANEEQMSAFLDSFRSENHPPIAGIMHAASVWEDEAGHSLVRTLGRLDRGALAAVFRAKVTGSWILHKLFAQTDLDFLVLFSSAASLLGSPGQGNYAAAGAFLDALAQYLRARGQKAFSISWGPVAGTGFGASAEGLKVHEHWEARGIQRITSGQVTEAISRIVSQDISHLAVAKLDWRLLQKLYIEMAALPWATNLIAEAGSESANQAAKGAASQLRQKLVALTPDDQRHLLESHLSEQVAMALRLPLSRLDIHQPITNLGFDSLMAIELRNRIQTDLGVVLPIVQLLQGPSVALLVTFLLEQLPGVEPLGSATVPRPASAVESIDADLDQLSAVVDQLSDERVEALLKDILASDSTVQ
jgi:natural product biosynthesis luciferase-like monooxygenase protein